MIKEPSIFIEHILKSIERIESFSKGISKEKLFENELIQSAIIRQIEIIGEAVKNFPKEFTKKYSSVSWSEIARTRDKLIHHYFGVDLESVWKVVKDDLPKLKKEINKIIKQEK